MSKMDWIKEISRLEVLEGLLKFAETQRIRRSPYTGGWMDGPTEKKWKAIVKKLRETVPEKYLKELDDAQKRQEHRPNCPCILCKELREFVESGGSGG